MENEKIIENLLRDINDSNTPLDQIGTYLDTLERLVKNDRADRMIKWKQILLSKSVDYLRLCNTENITSEKNEERIDKLLTQIREELTIRKRNKKTIIRYLMAITGEYAEVKKNIPKPNDILIPFYKKFKILEVEEPGFKEMILTYISDNFSKDIQKQKIIEFQEAILKNKIEVLLWFTKHRDTDSQLIQDYDKSQILKFYNTELKIIYGLTGKQLPEYEKFEIEILSKNNRVVLSSLSVVKVLGSSRPLATHQPTANKAIIL